MLKDNIGPLGIDLIQNECDGHNGRGHVVHPLVVNIDPVSGYKNEYHSLNDFALSCIDQQNFKVKAESYIYSEFPDYNCENCTVITYSHPSDLMVVQAYRIVGKAIKYDTNTHPHKPLDEKVVNFLIGKTGGVPTANTDKKNISYFLATDNMDLFVQLAKAGESVVLANDIDTAFEIINKTLPESIFRMMTGFNEPKQNQDLFVKLDESFKKNSFSQIKQFFTEKKDQLVKAITFDTFEQHPKIEVQKDIGLWGELIPLIQDRVQVDKPYPLHALSPIARDAAMAIAEYVQAPIAMTAQSVIGAMSHIAQAHVNAPHQFNVEGEPCGLYLLTEGQSGSRKSSSREMSDKAIMEYERKRYDLYNCDLLQWESGKAGLSKKDYETYIAENQRPCDPSTLYSDITLESIAGLYVDGILYNASIASDEAGQFFGGYTMKGDNRAQAIGVYAKLFDNGFVERTRSKANLNGSGRAYDVRLTFNLQGQHEVLADALKDPLLRGQGFLPRFILTVPENLAGTRLHDESYLDKDANLDQRLITYWSRCEYLLDDCPRLEIDRKLHNGRYVIPMTEQAKEENRKFYNMFEEQQGKGKRYEYLQAFASRAPQLARRLATVFAYFEGLLEIDAKILTGAYEIVEHSLNAWAMYADIEVKMESNPERLIKWLVKKCREQKTNCILKNIALKGAPSPLRQVDKFNVCLGDLIDFNYVRLKTINKTAYIELNPLLLK